MRPFRIKLDDLGDLSGQQKQTATRKSKDYASKWEADRRGKSHKTSGHRQVAFCTAFPSNGIIIIIIKREVSITESANTRAFWQIYSAKTACLALINSQYGK